MNFNRVPKPEWCGEFTFGAGAWPTNQLTVFCVYQVDACGFEEIAFGGLHIFKEIRKMDEAGHVGFGKFNASGRCMLICHGKIDEHCLKFGKMSWMFILDSKVRWRAAKNDAYVMPSVKYAKFAPL
jgi:hypothetical protein